MHFCHPMPPCSKATYAYVLIDRLRMVAMVGGFMVAGGRSMERGGTATIPSLSHFSAYMTSFLILRERAITYTNWLIDGLIIRFAVGVGGIRWLHVGVPTPLRPTLTLCKT